MLIDLDNLGVRKVRLGETLAALRRAAGDVPALAAGHPTVVSEEVRQICVQMGVDLLAVETGPNAADRALLHRGSAPARSWRRELVRGLVRRRLLRPAGQRHDPVHGQRPPCPGVDAARR
ncbi:hypothetical protein ACI78V_02015 [Geodermatophilus sp. SYSU D00742]